MQYNAFKEWFESTGGGNAPAEVFNAILDASSNTPGSRQLKPNATAPRQSQAVTCSMIANLTVAELKQLAAILDSSAGKDDDDEYLIMTQDEESRF